ncbi:MAG: HlyD family efflux transporter periplasmic adaptor subunit [Bacteroidetes bacterium]|nr:HlyD family efflux transporter periplasmic adaptor subunit [Bacteroidota bacterium]
MKYTVLVILLIGLMSCSKKQDKSDAYGNFEGDDVIISAQASGQLLSWSVAEGMKLEKDQVVGLVDTLSVSIQIQQIYAQKRALLSNLAKIQSQAAVSEEKLKSLEVEKNRIEKLMKEGAATPQQKDNLQGEINVIQKQIASITTQVRVVIEESKVLNKQIDLLLIQKDKCKITNPLNGTVLTTFVNKNEMVMTGKPLYKIANLNEMQLRVYVAANQLASIEIGQDVRVFVDNSQKGLDEYIGKVSWISEQAEFTPKIIQTREERVNQVYAIKLLVKNDGKLKIGMPAEVVF